MKISACIEVLPYLFKARIVPFLWGPTGIGKTSLVHQVGLRTNCIVISKHLATQETGDLVGMMYRDGDFTRWAKPAWWPSGEQDSILFLDELNRVEDDSVRQSIFELVRERRLHVHELPDNCNIVAAGNPVSSHYDVTDISDMAYIARFGHITIDADIEEFESHGKSSGFHENVLKFVTKNPTCFIKDHEFRTPEVSHNPRGWECVSNLEQAGLRNAVSAEVFHETLCGIIGPVAASQYCAWTKDGIDEPPSMRSMLDGWSHCRKVLLDHIEQGNHAWVGRFLENLITGLKSPIWSGSASQHDVQLASIISKDVVLMLDGDMQMGFSRELTMVPWLYERLKHDKQLTADIVNKRSGLTSLR